MKIVLSILTLNLDVLGGLHIRISELIRGFVKEGHDVSIIQTPRSAKNSKKFIQSMSGQVHSIVLDNITIPQNNRLYMLYIPILWHRASKFILQEGADVYDLWDPLTAIENISGHGYKTIYSSNHYTKYILLHWRNCGWRTLPYILEIPSIERMIRLYPKKVDGFIVENNSQKDTLNSHHVPESAVGLIPSGYDQKVLGIFEAARKPRKKDGERKSMVFTGRIQKWKGVYELFNVFCRLAREFTEWDLHLVGDGPELSILKEKVARCDLDGRVVFWGRLSYAETQRVVSQGDIFVFPSYIETFGQSVLQAMVLQVPVVTTDIVGKVIGIIQEGYSGSLVPVKNEDLLYTAVRELILDPELRDYLAQNGHDLAKEFTNDAMVRKTISFYER